MIKFPQDFCHAHHVCNDANDAKIQKSIDAVQKRLRKCYKAGKADYCFVESNYLVIGMIDEQGERTMFVTKDFYSIDYLPDEGWMKWGENNESTDSL